MKKPATKSKSNFFETKSYQKILQELSAIFQQWTALQGSRSSENDLRYLWQVGQKLEQAKNLVAAPQKTELLQKLSADLKRERTQLFRFQQFYEHYPKSVEQVPGYQSLTWAHYQEVLALPDPRERDFYLAEAARDAWASRRIRTAVQHKLYQHTQQSRSAEHPNGTIEKIVTHFYVYQTRVEAITDPDTLQVFADQGFNAWQHLIGRLRGINAPELHGPERERALAGTEFVKSSLSGLKKVVVQSHKNEREKFGRYLIDVFFHPVWEDADKIYLEGFFLNQILLDRGFAKLAVY